MRSKDLKIGMRVWTLNGGKRQEQYIDEIFEDRDEEDYPVTACYTVNWNDGPRSYYKLDEVYADEESAKRAEEQWKDNYDGFVTGGWM